MDDVKSSHIFLILFLLFIAAVGGYFFYFYKNSLPGTPQDSISRGVTSTWKTYTNTAYGFEFKYPSNRTAFQSIDAASERLIPATPTNSYIAVAHREGAYIFNSEPQIVSVQIKNENIDPRNWLNTHKNDYFGSSDPEYIKDTTFAGKKALEAGGSGNIGSTYRLIVVPYGNNTLVINQNAKSTLLDDVVSSFRFTR